MNKHRFVWVIYNRFDQRYAAFPGELWQLSGWKPDRRQAMQFTSCEDARVAIDKLLLRHASRTALFLEELARQETTPARRRLEAIDKLIEEYREISASIVIKEFRLNDQGQIVY